MKRVAIVVPLASFVGLLAMAAPALAKGPGDETTVTGSVTVSGPGMRAPGSMSGDVAEFAAEIGGLPVARFPHRPEGSLGPRYLVTMAFVCTSTEVEPQAVSISGELYPFAAFGVWANTPPHAGCFGDTISGGWHLVPSSVLETLTQMGVPAAAPSVPRPPAAVSASTGGPRNWVYGVVAGALGVMIVVAALAERRRRSRPALAG